MAGAFHGVGEPDTVINVGVSGPGVVKVALEACKGQPFDVVADTIKEAAFKVTRMGMLVASEASRRLDMPFGIVDLSLAPTPAVGDQHRQTAGRNRPGGLRRYGHRRGPGHAQRRGEKGRRYGVFSCGGRSGAFIPVSEDEGMIAAVNSGALSIEKLEAMTCVCSVGLDMIAVPGTTTPATISGIIADEAAIGVINNKTTAVRIIPVIGKDVGDSIEMGGLLGTAPGDAGEQVQL